MKSDSMNNEQVKKLINTLKTLIETFSYMHQDLEHVSTKDTPLYYNVDFSIMFPYLFPENPDTASDFLGSGKELFEILLNIDKSEVPFKLAFSGASFWELADLINHHFQFWRTKAQRKTATQDDLDSLRTRLDAKEVSFLDATNILNDSGYPIRYLESISTQGFENHVTRPLVKAKEIFSNANLFTNLGDKAPNTKKFFEAYETLFLINLDGMLKGRRDRNSRSRVDREFHYSVDASNWSLSEANNVRNEAKILYATPVKYIMNKAKDGINCRTPLVPAFLINANILCKQGVFNNELSYIENGLQCAVSVLHAINKERGDIGKIPPLELNQLNTLIEYYITPLNSSSASNTDPALLRSKEDIIDVLGRGAKNFTNTAEYAKENILVHANELIECALDSIHEDLVRHINFHENKVVRKIANNLNISLKI